MKLVGTFAVEVEMHRDGYRAAFWETDLLPGFEPLRRVTGPARERRHQAERDARREIKRIEKSRSPRRRPRP
jgi:hypothetical protein